MMTEQSAKADARHSAQNAAKPDPEVAQQALQEAQARDKRMPAQKLTASLSPAGKGVVEHHAKDRIVSEFDDPAANKVE